MKQFVLTNHIHLDMKLLLSEIYVNNYGIVVYTNINLQNEKSYKNKIAISKSIFKNQTNVNHFVDTYNNQLVCFISFDGKKYYKCI